ncbi:MAG: hypothetical protein HOI35_05435 [Woeseia sp.]|nr:hypothetical protein [Woeseia sp.]MBT6209442.1 hypothetical protein [Woeseia sp.]
MADNQRIEFGCHYAWPGWALLAIRKSSHQKIRGLALLLYTSVIDWKTMVSPQAGISSAAAPAFAAVTLCLANCLFMQYRKNSRSADIANAVTTAFVGLTQDAAAVVVFMQGPVVNPERQKLYHQVTFLMLPAGYTGVAIFLLFILVSGLSEEL